MRAPIARDVIKRRPFRFIGFLKTQNPAFSRKAGAGFLFWLFLKKLSASGPGCFCRKAQDLFYAAFCLLRSITAPPCCLCFKGATKTPSNRGGAQALLRTKKPASYDAGFAFLKGLKPIRSSGCKRRLPGFRAGCHRPRGTFHAYGLPTPGFQRQQPVPACWRRRAPDPMCHRLS